MAIDIHAKWQGQTEEQKQAQCTGFSAVHGHEGYLREVFHGGPFATRFLIREVFESSDRKASVPASVLRDRLPETLSIVAESERTAYGSSDEADITGLKRRIIQFVELCERKERETGEPMTITASYS